MPMSADFYARLAPHLPEICAHYGTPFHIYDETGIRKTCQDLIDVFHEIAGFQEYFAVKALPNPAILNIMHEMGFGFDCSSIAELQLARQAGAAPEDIMFTSNNTSQEEFQYALADSGCILNLDDISLLPKLPEVPELICFRYNPGPLLTGNAIIGDPAESKYGVSTDQIHDAFATAKARGAKRFGLHTMLVSNELDYTYKVHTVQMLLELVEALSVTIDTPFEFINIGGGLGIPYRAEEKALDLPVMASEITAVLNAFQAKQGYMPKLFLESGRYMTGPHGVLVTQAINRKDIYRTYIGVDACMSALMRPGMYGAYHHITVFGKEHASPTTIVDVVGSLCENNDKFAVQRPLPAIEDGDLLMIHDSGAHGHAMGFNYNGKVRPKELLLKTDGSIALIRREETLADYFATLQFEADCMIF